MGTRAEFATGQVLWAIVCFTLFSIWIWILISVFGDFFRSDDLGGVGKTLWIVFVIVVPYLGVFIYLIARGKGMQARGTAAALAQDTATRQYIQSVAGSGSTSAADEIARLSDLRDEGTTTEEGFQQLKAKALSL